MGLYMLLPIHFEPCESFFLLIDWHNQNEKIGLQKMQEMAGGGGFNRYVLCFGSFFGLSTMQGLNKNGFYQIFLCTEVPRFFRLRKTSNWLEST